MDMPDTITILPSVLSGDVVAPPSKSFAHRMLICAALAGGATSRITGISASEDMSATLDCISALGAKVKISGDAAEILGATPHILQNAVLPCRESGSTLRFMIPVALSFGGDFVFAGSERLLERGISVYEKIFSPLGIAIRKKAAEISFGGQLAAGKYVLPGDVSSQFVSGLLFALPLLEGESSIEIVPPVESRPYIDITLAVLREFGIAIEERRENVFFVSGGQRYAARTACVEGDWSNAAALLAFNHLGNGGGVRVGGLNEQSIQGDRACVKMLASLQKERATIDISACPDLGPVLFAVAAANHGALFTGTRRLKIKESDRAQAMAAELLKFGVLAEISENSVLVSGGSETLLPPKQPLDSHNDHRIVMALTLLASKTGGTICDCKAVSKSYPEFFAALKKIGLRVG